MTNTRIDILRINNFRNYTHFEYDFIKNINLITGDNGAGKTTILDSIYYATNGRSYFTHLDSNLYKKGESFFNIKASLSLDEEIFELLLTSSRQNGKQIKLDDKIIKSITEYYGRFSSFMIAPKDILILIDSSVERRKIIDRTIALVDKTYFKYLLQYNKLLKQRNAALKSFTKSGRKDTLLIDAIDSKMIEPMTYIFEKRKLFIKSLAPQLNFYYSELAELKEDVTLSYKSKLLEHDPAILLSESREKDFILAKTHEGIHRDDLILRINEVAIKRYASQGQLKSAIVALKLAQIDWVRKHSGKSPILLLDDIFDKLDIHRVKKLIELACNNSNSQVFITDTDSSRVSGILNELNFTFDHLYINDGKHLESE